MRKLFVFLSTFFIVLINVTSAFSEQFWAKTFGGTQWDYAKYIQQTLDGGYILTGYTLSFGTDSDAWVVKLDGSGNVVWEKRYGGNVQDEAHYIQQTLDGGYILRGCYDCSTDNTWLLKLDSAGEIMWQKTYPRTLNDLKQTRDGGYILAGTDDLSDSKIDFCVVKLDSNGTILWQQTYGSSTWWRYEYAYSIQQTADDGYIVAGKDAVQGCSNCGNILMLKLDSSGTITWQRVISGRNPGAYSILQTEDGYIIAGYVEGSTTSYDALVLKIYNNGDFSWQKAYGGNNYDYAFSIRPISDTNYLVAGRNSHTEAMWLLEIDNRGAVVRQKMCETCNVNCLEHTIEGGYVVVGTTSSFGVGMGDIIAFNLDSNWEISNCNVMSTAEVLVWEPFPGYRNTDVIPIPISETLTDTTVTPQDTLAETSIVCCYDTEDNDYDCVPLEEDNCPNDYNPNQEDELPHPNGNGIPDACDCEGNFDCDGDCDGTDAAVFKGDFGRSQFQRPCTNADQCKGDFDCDVDVDGTDAALFKQDFGRSQFSNPCPACVVGEWCSYPLP